MEGEKEEGSSAPVSLGDGVWGACRGGLGWWRGGASEARTGV